MPILFVIERDEVERSDISRVEDFFKTLLASEKEARANFQNIDISFYGCDGDTRELFEIENVREFVRKLDARFPHWLYFMDLSCLGLHAIGNCFLPPHLTKEGRAKHHPGALMNLFTNRWLPALNELGKQTGISEMKIDLLTSRCVNYFLKGKERPPEVN